jgi:hypothetical protein
MATKEREKTDGRHIPEKLIRMFNEDRAKHFVLAVDEPVLKCVRSFVLTRMLANAEGAGLHELTGRKFSVTKLDGLDEAKARAELDRLCDAA